MQRDVLFLQISHLNSVRPASYYLEPSLYVDDITTEDLELKRSLNRPAYIEHDAPIGTRANGFDTMVLSKTVDSVQ